MSAVCLHHPICRCLLPAGLLAMAMLILVGCENRQAEAARQGLNDAGDEVTKAAKKVADAVRGEKN